MASPARVVVLTPLPRNLVLIETVELPPRTPRPPPSDPSPSTVTTVAEAAPLSSDDAPRTPPRASLSDEQPRMRWPAIASGIVMAFALFAGAEGAVTVAEVLAFIAAMLFSMAIVVRVLCARA